MSSLVHAPFIETKEYRRFVEFCDSCCRYRYIGLCYGAPGVGKTLSARHYTRWDAVEHYRSFAQKFSSAPQEILGSHLVFYTPKVVNSPGQIEQDIARLRANLRDLIDKDLLHKRDVLIRYAYQRERQETCEFLRTKNWPFEKFSDFPRSQPTIDDVVELSVEQRRNVKDPTELIVIDEADRLKMAGLEQVRDIFDRGGVGVVLIGMPGLEKRLARYPQLYSRVGFVHELRALSHAEIRQLLKDQWSPSEVSFPEGALADDESIATIIRVTGGNFRLLHRLLTQIGRVVEINNVAGVTKSVVEAARESLVIGAA